MGTAAWTCLPCSPHHAYACSSPKLTQGGSNPLKPVELTCTLQRCTAQWVQLQLGIHTLTHTTHMHSLLVWPVICPAGFGASAFMGPLLQNLCLSMGDNEEACFCLKVSCCSAAAASGRTVQAV